ncbi:glycerol-3-phosphate dehydrogenase/oxidase [Jeotgalicoccus nanhaiensis]|jgi:Glycerol-3-phosphate dehydrogenase|uniref:Glycerol-3-phosphate dehydrogenase n=2 Tax=Staphylococcaceae TaxID=90964 RepID=A0ABR9XVT1_9STAP|nr:glycerol-3-phosphate dehydrogenase/oxidase [Jeotgalicoccus nanhaiensis]MBF0752891.1 glycerol-3-phosphate dehydrogenase/oxidase [Jeotgalicoccus nanhaiensis]
MLNALTRKHQLDHMSKFEYDLLIIGGGITGAGIALDASMRGLNVALVEMQDFSEGTSSRSTKLIHGGLRYLKQMQVNVVRETGRERAIVYENGPHVTTPEWMLLPFHKGGTFGEFTTSLGLKVYDSLAQVDKNERRNMLTKQEVIERVPNIKSDGLRGGGHYVEYKTDDARLTVEVMKKAASYGADAVNYVKADGFLYDNGTVTGIKAKDVLRNDTYEIKSKAVVNATGPWVDEVRANDQAGRQTKKHLVHTKGVHIVFKQEDFPLTQAVYFDTKDDGRMIFAIPRAGKTYVGTTDTFYGENKARPKAETEDKAYLVDAINFMFPTLNIDISMIESSWAGIRPLIQSGSKNASDISRKDEIWHSTSGLITIAGGKLTGYRHMAEEIVDEVAEYLKKHHKMNVKKVSTKNEPVSGGDVGGSVGYQNYVDNISRKAPSYGLTLDEGHMLAMKYGSNVEAVYQYAGITNDNHEKYSLPKPLYAEVIYGILHEMVIKPADFFVRRSGKLYFEIEDVVKYRSGVEQLLQDTLSYDDETRNQFSRELDEAIEDTRK